MYFQLKFKEDKKCEAVCTKEYKGGNTLSQRNLQYLKKGMSLNYQHHWIVGNML